MFGRYRAHHSGDAILIFTTMIIFDKNAGLIESTWGFLKMDDPMEQLPAPEIVREYLEEMGIRYTGFIYDVDKLLIFFEAEEGELIINCLPLLAHDIMDIMVARNSHVELVSKKLSKRLTENGRRVIKIKFKFV